MALGLAPLDFLSPQWLEIGPVEAPPPEESVIVLIGRDLDQEELQRAWGKLPEA